MFRREEVYVGDWREKTLESMQKRRFQQMAAQLPQLGENRIRLMNTGALTRRLEGCWQSVERKPLRSQQEREILRSVLSTINLHADCLSPVEHDLVDRALILGGSVQLRDIQELEAAQALSLRLWANVGLVTGKPYMELEGALLSPMAKAFARPEHEEIRSRFDILHGYLASTLYRIGVMDDRQPQMMIIRDVIGGDAGDEAVKLMARRYLWASFDCVDYQDGVLLIHSALAEPKRMMGSIRRKTGLWMPETEETLGDLNILPEEVPLQQALERAVAPALRANCQAYEVASSIRYLCKQGAPLRAMEEVLQSCSIVYLTDAMRGALRDMYYRLPKWMECRECESWQ